MEPEISVEVAPSEDNGNVPAEAPSEPTAPATPTEPTEPAKPAEPELFELPDGRKVDAGTLTKEWKENFLPDYTRKSQELAKARPTETLPEAKPTNPLADPNWTPSSYGELVEMAEKRALAAIEAKEQQRIDGQKALEDAVAGQLSDVKKLDATVNENALFLHATKYGFRDLRQAHQNMKDMSEMMKKVQTTTAQNITKRTDPVSVSHGAAGARPDPSNFSNARDYLRMIKN